MSGGAQLRGFAPDTVFALTGSDNEPQTARTDSDVVTN